MGQGGRGGSRHEREAVRIFREAMKQGAGQSSCSANFVTDGDAVEAVFDAELAKLSEFDQYAVGRQLARCLERMLLIPPNATCEILPGCTVEHVVLSNGRSASNCGDRDRRE